MAVCYKYDRAAYCWFDGSTWEWENFNEPDGTSDHSWLTSVSTDFKLLTSIEDDLSNGSHEDEIGYFWNSGYANCRYPEGPNPYCNYLAAEKEEARHDIKL
jgi:hypothetical protein